MNFCLIFNNFVTFVCRYGLKRRDALFGRYSVREANGQRNPQAHENRGSSGGVVNLRSAVDELAGYRAVLQAEQDFAIVAAARDYDDHESEYADHRYPVVGGGRGGAVPGRLALPPARPQRSVRDTFVEFTRGLVGGGIAGPDVDASHGPPL